MKKHAQEIWERHWMDPEMQTTLLNNYNPKLMETILKALRGQFNEDDQMDTAEGIGGPASKIPIECEQILGEWEDFGTMSTMFFYLKIQCLTASSDKCAGSRSDRSTR